MKKFTSVHDVNNIKQMVEQAMAFKKNPFSSDIGKRKTIGMLFLNPSLRTRMSTQKAAQNLGMQTIMLDAQSGWKLEFEDGVVMNGDKAEHIKDAALVISQYCDILAVRSFPSLSDREKDYADTIVNNLVEYATIPVLSLESAIRHPLQSLADMITIEELKKQQKPKVVLTWAPHPRSLPQAVSNSFAEWALASDYNLTIAHPEGLELCEDFTKGAKIMHNQEEAFEGADFVYIKNWSSYKNYGQSIQGKEDWMITKQKLENTNNAKIMHCLPMRRNVVISDCAMDSEHNAIFQQAGNREWAAQAVIAELLK